MQGKGANAPTSEMEGGAKSGDFQPGQPGRTTGQATGGEHQSRGDAVQEQVRLFRFVMLDVADTVGEGRKKRLKKGQLEATTNKRPVDSTVAGVQHCNRNDKIASNRRGAPFGTCEFSSTGSGPPAET